VEPYHTVGFNYSTLWIPTQNTLLSFIYVSIPYIDPPNITVSNSLLEPGREGVDSVTLTCLADANPPATYRWTRKSANAAPLTEDNVYVIDPVDRTHIDIYACVATNYLGSSQPGPVDVNVLYAPNMTVTASSTAPLVEGRDSVTLDCQVYTVQRAK
jgi:hypothetical protein